VYQSVTRIVGIASRMNRMPATTYGVKLYVSDATDRAAAIASVAARIEMSPTSFCIEMKSFMSGGVIFRSACGSTTRRSVCT
jgi:hypothetical protein